MASLLTKPSAISRQLLHEAREHPPHFADLGVELTMGLGGEVPQVASDEQPVLGLARRASGGAEEASQFAPAFATASLSHARGDRPRGLAGVGSELEALVVGEGAALRVDVEHQPVRLLPDLQLLEVTHGSSPVPDACSSRDRGASSDDGLVGRSPPRQDRGGALLLGPRRGAGNPSGHLLPGRDDHKYYLTALGRRTLLAGLHIRAIVLPQMLKAHS